MGGREMNTKRLQTLIQASGLNKSQIAERCGVSRATLDNLIAGGDAKMSTAESIARVLGVRVGYLFDESDSQTDQLLADVQELRSQLAATKNARAARITVEVDMSPEELQAAGLTEKVIEKLRRR